MRFSPGSAEFERAIDIVNKWRAAHAYPINTFNSTLRRKVRGFDEPIVAQRLKRLPTIIEKLKRFPTMYLARMQDIGGVRAVVNTIEEVRDLEAQYTRPNAFSHILHHEPYDYIGHPKSDGYRGVHLVYKYHNTLARNGKAQEYEDLLVELQLRTKLQHTWATAVETVGTILGEGFKSGLGNEAWREFFALVSSAFAIIEKSPVLEQHSKYTNEELFKKLIDIERRLKVREQIQGLTVAADAIQQHGIGGYYNLIILDLARKSVRIRAYTSDQLLQASRDLAEMEKKQSEGTAIDAVLVSAGRLKLLKRAYPNYFLDIRDFLKKIEIIVQEAHEVV